MAGITSFKAEARERTGKGGARALRRAGKVPAIVYGGGEEPTKVALPVKELKRQISTNPRFFSSVVDLELDGKVLHVLPREAQLHPVTDEPLHIDFVRAEGGARVTVAVPVRFINEPASPGLKRGGVLNIVRREVELVCPADAHPGRARRRPHRLRYRRSRPHQPRQAARGRAPDDHRPRLHVSPRSSRRPSAPR